MLKKLASVLLFITLSNAIFAQKKDDILGKWLNSSGEGQIEIFKKGDSYFGKLVWIKEPNDQAGKPILDVKNPNVALRNKPIVGLEIVKGFVFDEDEWTDGKVYDPKTGKSYSGSMSLSGANKLKMRGYVGISLIGRTEVWTRVK